ncbi:ABC transporter permease [Nocardioides sp.]|uniref:ABC transporter permease n=1 Tax=Nocardioides sp. TaxID=35761 RepID=UPI002A061EC4|nr:ABC-type transporter, integral rane subunit [Nocardioides sp.]MCW2795710.1 ABC-type transporter, integral rane subunit [Nocardioides sp.]
MTQTVSSPAPAAHEGETGQPAGTRGRRAFPLPAREFRSVWIATAALFAVSLVVAPNSLSATSFAAMLSFAGVLMVVAAGQTIIVQQRGLDLAIPGAITLCSMVLPIYLTRSGSSLGQALVVTLVVGACIGVVNGLLVTRIGVTPLIATLAMNSILIGALLTYSKGLPSASAPADLVDFVSTKVLGVPVGFLIAFAYVLVLATVLSRTVVGRRFTAVGSSPAVARAAGINVDAYVVGAYVVGGVSSSIGAVLLLGYVESATVSLGNEYLFTSIAAVVIGGTAFSGGRGSVVATAVAAVFLTQLVQMLLASGAPTSVQLLAQALAIAVAVAIRTLAPVLRSALSSRS